MFQKQLRKRQYTGVLNDIPGSIKEPWLFQAQATSSLWLCSQNHCQHCDAAINLYIYKYSALNPIPRYIQVAPLCKKCSMSRDHKVVQSPTAYPNISKDHHIPTCTQIIIIIHHSHCLSRHPHHLRYQQFDSSRVLPVAYALLAPPPSSL